MEPKYNYRKWYWIFLNGWVIILLLFSVILFANNLFLWGALFLVINGVIIYNILLRIKKYNQIILSLLISEETLKGDNLEEYNKEYIKSSSKNVYENITRKEFWNENDYDKYWPKKIPLGDYWVYQLAQYWNEEDISKITKFNSELKFATQTKENAQKFIFAIKESEENDNERIERIAERTGKNYWDIVDAEREKEQIKIDEKNKKNEQELDRMRGNSAKMIFTGVTGKCPHCLKKISILASKCPYCTAELRT